MKIDFCDVAQVIAKVFLQEHEKQFETYLRNRNDFIRTKEKTANTWKFENALCKLVEISKGGIKRLLCLMLSIPFE